MNISRKFNDCVEKKNFKRKESRKFCFICPLKYNKYKQSNKQSG